MITERASAASLLPRLVTGLLPGCRLPVAGSQSCRLEAGDAADMMSALRHARLHPSVILSNAKDL